MALRIKSHWHNDESERSLADIASAAAFIIWRISKDKAINLHGEDYIYDDDAQRLRVILEYSLFQVQLADRMAHEKLDADGRRTFLIALAKRLAREVQENFEEILGEGKHGKRFIDLLNQRSAEYADFKFSTEDGPSYPFFRHLGYEIQQVMGGHDENRWVIDQVMDKDGPDMSKQMISAIDNLFS
ncbi:MAG: hypothetical protein KZQ58_06170 [gamma proteobacterium symbiont of Bathyaustriella thionipta]|nr:hypothetical protein [gamma proteobacterium symbiont of Bathyaustriella thionipta]